MLRVAALCLPYWPIDRLRQAAHRAAPLNAARASPSPDALPISAAAGPVNASAPRSGGWRPGARWARADKGSPACTGAGYNPDTLLPPLVTTIHDSRRVVIAAACPQALALGVRPGMPLAQVRAQISGIDLRTADPEGDAQALRNLAIALARRWSPSVTLAAGDSLFLDLTGTAHLFGGEARMAARLVRLLARMGFAARIAVADTPGAAWALARYARQPVTLCPAGDPIAALADLPIAALRVGDKPIELLARLGVERIGQLAALPRAPLVRRFGKGLAQRLEQALGNLPEPLDPIAPPEPISAHRRFVEPIATAEAIAHWLGALVPQLTAALEAAGLGTTRIELIAERIDGVPQHIRLGLARPSRDPLHLLRLLTRRIEDIEPGFGIDALHLHVRRAAPLGPEPFVERLDAKAAPDLAPLVDTLATRIGIDAMWRMRAVESDVPERSAARAPVLDPPEPPVARRKRDDIRQLQRSTLLDPWHPEWPKPARLLPRPERLDHVIAELPDHAPRRFTWRGAAHQVVRADGPERIHGEWWKHRAETHHIRDYFRVEDEVGRRYWLFRRGDGERAITGDLSWYLHGVFG